MRGSIPPLHERTACDSTGRTGRGAWGASPKDDRKKRTWEPSGSSGAAGSRSPASGRLPHFGAPAARCRRPVRQGCGRAVRAGPGLQVSHTSGASPRSCRGWRRFRPRGKRAGSWRRRQSTSVSVVADVQCSTTSAGKNCRSWGPRSIRDTVTPFTPLAVVTSCATTTECQPPASSSS